MPQRNATGLRVRTPDYITTISPDVSVVQMFVSPPYDNVSIHASYMTKRHYPLEKPQHQLENACKTSISMASFNTGAIKVDHLSPACLAQKVENIELSAKPFDSSIHATLTMHLYLMLISPSSHTGAKRLQLDVYCSLVNGVMEPEVTVTACDVVPTGTHIGRVLSFPILEPDTVRVGDLLALLTSAGLNTVTVNSGNTACSHFCFQALNTFMENGIIQGNWAQPAYEWHQDIHIASGPLAATLIEEDLKHL
ncbi:uncharacterized protein ARMOST_22153 [Armillaria ostoyae]|uniref:Uncharacterized protein n=1 Tax=Armillaria ostoyae TaxID=47428 RepID=A0A284SC59_ARMOS|nr:uncharacterized protein ARMOST_22153 [Armillaria ostoyae]